MAYTIPLKYIRVSNKRSDNRQFDVAICATRIVAIMSTEISQARKAISKERQNGTLINGCGLAKAKTAIFLDNGSVVSSPLTVRRLLTLINRDEQETIQRVEKKMRVVDVYEDEEDDPIEYEDEDDEEYDFDE